MLVTDDSYNLFLFLYDNSVYSNIAQQFQPSTGSRFPLKILVLVHPKWKL